MGCPVTSVPTSGKELGKNLKKLGRHYQWLSVNAFNAGMARWHTVGKFHFTLGHFAKQAELINRRWVQGLASESMVSTSNIYGMSQSGPGKAGAQKVVMTKNRVGLNL